MVSAIQISMDGLRGNDSVGESINIHAYVHQKERYVHENVSARTASSRVDIKSMPDSRGKLEINKLLCPPRCAIREISAGKT